jgi:hypothetical protein
MLRFPLDPDKLAKFKKTNKISITVVYIGPDGPHQTNLMYVSIHDDDPNFPENDRITLGYLKKLEYYTINNEYRVRYKIHFVLVTNLATLVTEAYDGEKNRDKKTCIICHETLSSQESMYKHYIRYHSGEHKKPEIVLPKPPNNNNRFNIYDEKHFKKTQRYPFVVYAEFESYNLKCDEDSKDPKIVTRQIPNSYLLFSPDLLFLEEADNHYNLTYEQRLSAIKKCTRFYMHYDPDQLLDKFVDDLMSLHALHCQLLHRFDRLQPLLPEEQFIFDNTTVCAECKEPFTSDNPKFRHHNHTTGKFMGAWCRKCNIHERKKNFKTYVVFHNFRGYDSHFIIRHGIRRIHECYQDNDNTKSPPQLSVTKSAERFSSIEYGCFRFMDSFLHLSTSLDCLVQQYKKSNGTFLISNMCCLLECLREKGVYPYKWVDSPSKF